MTDPTPPSLPNFPAELADDPLFQAQIAAETTRRLALATTVHADPTVLYADLQSFGAPSSALDTYFDRVHLPGRAMAVLVAHLSRPYAPDIWEKIVRSLTRPDARPTLPMLSWAYGIERDTARRWLLANALSAMATFAEVSALPGIEAYQSLFGPTMLPKHTRRPS